SSADRLNLPSASANILRLAILLASNSTSASVSPAPAPSKITRPYPISPFSRPSIVTLPLVTLCSNALIPLLRIANQYMAQHKGSKEELRVPPSPSRFLL